MHNNEYTPTQYGVGSTTRNESAECNMSTLERVLSAAAGAILVYTSLKRIGRRPLNKLYKAGIGGFLLYRGATGNCPVYTQLGIDGSKTTSVNIRDTFTVNKPKEEVYAFWRKLENLPKFMRHLSTVKEIDDTRSHWEAKIPENNPISVSWDAEIVKDDHNSFISWRSLPGSMIENAGKVEFRDALGRQGTEIRVMISYRPPAGNLGSGIAKLFNPMLDRMIREDITNFKQYIEFTNPSPLAAKAPTGLQGNVPGTGSIPGQSMAAGQPGGINNPNKQW
ncbi:MAG TPA: SRPBCC family protein [Flavitalea sp.]|nr:SRPBCC family protein [Flavitalea sp.]